VRQIERMLGAAVFDRHSGVGVTLTPVGQALLEFCERSIRGLDAFSAELDAIRTAAAPSGLRIIAPSDCMQYLLLPMLPEFRARHGRFALRVEQTGDCRRIPGALAGGQADLAFHELPAHSSLATAAWLDEQLHLVVAAGHELLSLPARDRPMAIGKHPFAAYAPGMRTRDLIQRWAAKNGITITPQIESNSVPVLKDAVLRNDAVGIVPGIAVLREVAAGQLVRADVAGMPLTRTKVVAVRPGDERSPQVRAFLTELMAACAAGSDGAAQVRWAAPPAPLATA
jgi:DNA-binding transcriptional LysR family regulator